MYHGVSPFSAWVPLKPSSPLTQGPVHVVNCVISISDVLWKSLISFGAFQIQPVVWECRCECKLNEYENMSWVSVHMWLDTESWNYYQGNSNHLHGLVSGHNLLFLLHMAMKMLIASDDIFALLTEKIVVKLSRASLIGFFDAGWSSSSLLVPTRHP